METTTHAVRETATGVGETTGVGDITHAVAKAAAYVVAAGNAHTHAVGETATAETADTYDAVVETHAVMGDRPLGSYARVVEAVAVPAIKYSPAGIVVKAKVIRACRGTAVSRIVHRPRRTGVLAGIRLCSGWLRSSKCSDGQPNGGSQQDRFGGKLAAVHRSLLGGSAPQFELFQSGRSKDHQQ
jgi:hypothetical protein